MAVGRLRKAGVPGKSLIQRGLEGLEGSFSSYREKGKKDGEGRPDAGEGRRLAEAPGGACGLVAWGAGGRKEGVFIGIGDGRRPSPPSPPSAPDYEAGPWSWPGWLVVSEWWPEPSIAFRAFQIGPVRIRPWAWSQAVMAGREASAACPGAAARRRAGDRPRRRALRPRPWPTRRCGSTPPSR